MEPADAAGFAGSNASRVATGPSSNVLAFEPRLEAHLFGPPSLFLNGSDLNARLGAKPRALIFLLLLSESNRAPRAWLASMLWAGQADSASRANLRLALSRLRQQLPGLVGADKQFVWIRPEDIFRVDALQVQHVAEHRGDASTAQLRAALENCRGEFLEGFEVRGAPEFDDWLRRSREIFQGHALLLVKSALDQLGAHGEMDARLWFTRQWVQLDETDEAANRQLMLLYKAMGRRSHAIKQYEMYRQLLAEKLGARPSAGLYELYREIHADAPREQPLIADLSLDPVHAINAAAVVSVSGIGELPHMASAIVGRQGLIASLASRFENPECRLLTLLGPGGIGKTRVAIAFAQNLPEPVTFVPLFGAAPASDPEEATDVLAQHIAQGLGLTFKSPESNRKVLLRHVTEQRGVLLLDGFEHLIAASPFLDELIEAAPSLRILVTSRERPAAASQWLLDVPGLNVQAADYDPSQGSTAFADGFALFESVAQRVYPAFSVSDNMAAVSRILQIVQGSPLAIELAAHWVRTLSCDEILDRLEQGLDLLIHESAPENSRHSSMEAVLESSWLLLDESTQRGLAVLSVFAASFDAVAAGTVAGLDAARLAGLVDRCWLTAIRLPRGTRFLMHDLVGHYVFKKLSLNPGDENGARERHALHFRAVVEKARGRLEKMDRETIQKIGPDRQNINVAWHWLRENRGPDELVAFVDACHFYYVHRGWVREAITLLEQALQFAGLDYIHVIRWERLLAQDQWHSGRAGRSRFHSERVLRLIGEPVPSGRGGSAIALVGSLTRHAIGPVLKPRSTSTQPWASDLVQSLARLSSIGYLAGEYPARLIHYALRCSELSAAHEIAAGITWSNSFLSVLSNAMGLRKLSDLYARRATAALPDMAYSEFDSVAYLNFGIDRFIAGQWDTATDLLDRGAACYQMTGQWRITMDTTGIRGLLLITRRQSDASHSCWAELRAQGHEYGDRLVELWGYLGAAECDLLCGTVPDLSALSRTSRYLPAGTRHEQARFDAVMAGGAWMQQDVELASHHAHKALLCLTPGGYLPFYDSEACFNCADVLLRLSKRSPLQESTRESALTAAKVAYKLARSNPFFVPRASQLMARAEMQMGSSERAAKYANQARVAAYALGLPEDAEIAAQLIAGENESV